MSDSDSITPSISEQRPESDRESVEEMIAHFNEPLIADMYERWVLDCVIGVVESIAADSIRRPRQYKETALETSETLEAFWFSGMSPGIPDRGKREVIFSALLGPSDGEAGEHESPFHAASSALRERARALSERQVDTSIENLRAAFEHEALTFEAYLGALTSNSVVKLSAFRTSNMFDRAVKALLDPAVARVFGKIPATTKNWPLALSLDIDGASLVEEVTTTLETGVGKISENQFMVMQRIGHFGAETIRSTLPKKDVDQMIQDAYNWQTAMDALSFTEN